MLFLLSRFRDVSCAVRGMPPKLHSGELVRSSVYCRIRPFAAVGGHATSEACDQKTLESWDESSVTIATEYLFSKGERRYTFPKQVLTPEAEQPAVYEATMPTLVNHFTANAGAVPRNVMFLAYGQTGTGKTHTSTMFMASATAVESLQKGG